MNINDWAIPGLTDKERDNFMAALEEARSDKSLRPKWDAVDPDGKVVGTWREGWRGSTPDRIREWRDRYHPGTKLLVTRYTATTVVDGEES